MDKKRVNIYPRRPIDTNPPIRSAVLNRTKDIKDIRKAIMCDARVEEILPDGSVVLLNISNYDIDNSGKSEKRPAPAPKKAEPERVNVTVKVPVEEHKEEFKIKVEDKKEDPAPVEDKKDEPKPAEDEKKEEPQKVEGVVEKAQLSRKQRKALERQQRENAEAPEETIETEDVE